MSRDVRDRWEQFSIAMAECRRAEKHWSQLKEECVGQVEARLSEKEARHLTHTVFRINALLFLYTRLRGQEHSTRLGVLLGAITYLLDYVYDHHVDSTHDVEPFEEVLYPQRERLLGTDLERVLGQLAAEAWDAVADRELMRVQLDAMLQTQRASMAQEGGASLPAPLLEKLTKEKGHRSLCLYFAAVNPGFDLREKQALRKFGLYMQYMDDLEDYYEDLREGRCSPIQSPWSGIRRASRLLAAAWPDLRRYYGRISRRRYRVFMVWISVYHLGIVLACLSRELTRRMPLASQVWIDRFTERLAKRNPFFYVAPVGLTYGTSPPGERTMEFTH